MNIARLLDMAGIRVSDEQMAAISSDTSTVVSAGAGSGKTTVLSLRFVRLVLEGKAHADEILTLTFTKKAAAEMYERIHSLLSIAAAEDGMIAEELSERFPKARISTMDSFWSEIARTDSLRFGVTRDFQSIEAEDGKEEELVRRVYERIQGRDELQEGFFLLSELYTSSDILSLLRTVASSETDILTAFDADRNTSSYVSFISLLRDHLVSDRAGYIFSSLADLNEEFPDNGQSAEIEAALEAYRNDDFSSLPVFNLNKLRKAADKPVQSFIKEEGVKEYFVDLRAFQALEATEGESSAVSAVLAAFISEYQREKRVQGLLSYRDTESLCRAVLVANTEVRDYYKGRFRWIMVDEFQDNNGKQRDLLYLLSERMAVHSPSIPPVEALERSKLFFVGDDKQSIYYFRGADVSVFRSLKDDIRRIGGQVLSLSANYRSEPALINHFNGVFDSVFSVDITEDDMQEEKLMESFTGERYASFHASPEPNTSRSPYPGIRPCLMVEAVPKRERGKGYEGYASDEDSEAAFIADQVREMVSGDRFLIGGKEGARRPRYSDIAILLRTTAPQMPIERAFRSRGIPYVVQESTSSTLEGVGWDIYAFLQLLVYPEDRLAYMAVLRSPFARISDDGLLFLASDHSLAFASDPDLGEEDRKAYESVRRLYEELRSMVGRRRITEILTSLFYGSGYSTYLLSSSYLSVYAEHYSYIWAAAARYDAASRSLPDFLGYIRPLIGQAEKLSNAAVQHLETDGVQIMTIHRSKGLQFPIVFISDADHGPGGRAAQSRLISLEGKNACIMPDLTERGTANPILRTIGAYRTRREEAELRRLLYVALTRAVDHVIITAHMRSQRRGPSLLDVYLEGYGGVIGEIPRIGEDEIFRKHDEEMDLSWYSQPVAPEPLYSEKRFGVKDHSHDEQIQWDEGGILPDLPSDEVVARYSIQSDFGTMVHAELEAFMRGKEAEHIMPSAITEGESRILLEALHSIREGFAASAFYHGYVECHECSAEVRFYYPMDGAVAEGSADLIIFGEDCNLVVDYKTDRRMNEERHKAQITAYAKAMEDLYGKRCLAVLLYVRGWRQGTILDKLGNPVKEPLQL